MKTSRWVKGWLTLGLWMAALGGCGRPTLTLSFAGLDRDAQALTVHLSSPTWRFAGGDVPVGPVSVAHPGDGVLEIGIDRGYLAAHGDRLRLPLQLSGALEVNATARATTGEQVWTAATHGAAAPDRDLTLAFLFGAAQPADGGEVTGTDGGAATPDATTDGPPPTRKADAGPDGPGLSDTATPDSAADALPAPDTAGPDVPPSCIVGQPKPASIALPSSRPTIAFAGGIFGVAWNDRGEIRYNAVDADGKLQNARDVLVAAAGIMETTSLPRLVAAGGGIGLFYGRQNGGASFRSTAFKVLAPATGASTQAPIFHDTLTGAGLPELGGAVLGEHGQLVLIHRIGGDQPSQARLEIYGSNPPTAFGARTLAALAATRATGLGWAPAGRRFAAAALIDGSASGGRLITFDADLGDDRNFTFTRPGDAPVIGVAGATISVAGGADRFAVAWIDGQGCSGCTSGRELYLALFDSTGSTLLAKVHASDATPTPKSYPHLVFDGRSFVAVWSEYVSTTDAAVKLRRFDQNLAPLGPPLDLTAGAAHRPLGDLDLAAAAPNDYGVALTLFTETHQFIHVTCSGP
jgi:hypothetical protein